MPGHRPQVPDHFRNGCKDVPNSSGIRMDISATLPSEDLATN